MREYNVNLVLFDNNGEELSTLTIRGLKRGSEKDVREHCFNEYPDYEIVEIKDISPPKTPELIIEDIEKALKDRGLEVLSLGDFLKHELDRLVKVEDYERAAEVRDAIIELENSKTKQL